MDIHLAVAVAAQIPFTERFIKTQKNMMPRFVLNHGLRNLILSSLAFLTKKRSQRFVINTTRISCTYAAMIAAWWFHLSHELFSIIFGVV